MSVLFSLDTPQAIFSADIARDRHNNKLLRRGVEMCVRAVHHLQSFYVDSLSRPSVGKQCGGWLLDCWGFFELPLWLSRRLSTKPYLVTLTWLYIQVIDQTCAVKMAGYCSSSGSINAQKSRDIFTWLSGKLSCGTQRVVPIGQDIAILAARVVNRSQRRIWLILPIHSAIMN